MKIKSCVDCGNAVEVGDDVDLGAVHCYKHAPPPVEGSVHDGALFVNVSVTFAGLWLASPDKASSRYCPMTMGALEAGPDRKVEQPGALPVNSKGHWRCLGPECMAWVTVRKEGHGACGMLPGVVRVVDEFHSEHEAPE